MKTIHKIFVLVFILANISLFAQTTIPALINSNVTWSLSQSPYLVASNVLIGANAHVTIEPGVVIRFGAGTEMLVRGEILAIGTEQDSIYLIPDGISTSPNTEFWEGIRFDNTPGASIKLRYVYSSDAEAFIDLQTAQGSDTILHIEHSTMYSHNRVIDANDFTKSFKVYINFCDFIDTQGYVIFGSSNFYVSNSLFDGNFRGSYNGTTQIAQFERCVFRGSYDAGLIIDGIIRNCEFYENSKGFSTAGNGPIAEFNYIHDNDLGIQLSSNASSTLGDKIQFNTICGNTINARMILGGTSSLKNNCWCSLDSSAIATSTIDFFEESNLGFIEFMPVANTCSLGLINLDTNASNSLEISALINPVNEQISFKLNSTQADIIAITVTALNGSTTILESSRLIKPGINPISIASPQLNSGIYILKISGNYGSISRKIVCISQD